MLPRARRPPTTTASPYMPASNNHTLMKQAGGPGTLAPLHLPPPETPPPCPQTATRAAPAWAAGWCCRCWAPGCRCRGCQSRCCGTGGNTLRQGLSRLCRAAGAGRGLVQECVHAAMARRGGAESDRLGGARAAAAYWLTGLVGGHSCPRLPWLLQGPLGPLAGYLQSTAPHSNRCGGSAEASTSGACRVGAAAMPAAAAAAAQPATTSVSQQLHVLARRYAVLPPK